MITSEQFIKKFNYFTNYKFNVGIKWLTKKIRTLFQLKDKSLHPACKIYDGICICGEKYIKETKEMLDKMDGTQYSKRQIISSKTFKR